MFDATRYPAPWGAEMTHLAFILRKAAVIAIVAGLLCALALLFAAPFLFTMAAA